MWGLSQIGAKPADLLSASMKQGACTFDRSCGMKTEVGKAPGGWGGEGGQPDTLELPAGGDIHGRA